MKTSIITLLALWASALMAQKPATTHQVHFASGSASITPTTAESLQQFLQAPAQAYPCLKVTLAGHTDADGTDQANLALSQRRVQAVKQLLTEWGFPAHNLQVIAEGEAKPIADNDSDNGKAQNRRVELSIAKADCDLGRQGVPLTTLDFDIAKGITYTYPRSGTQVHIAPGSLTDPQGRTATGQATLHYREWRDPADFVLAGIPMQYPHNGTGDLFHSGGMYELRVTQNGKPLKPAPGKMPKIDFVQTEAANFDRFSLVGNNWQIRQPQDQEMMIRGKGGAAPRCFEPKTWGPLSGDTLATFRTALAQCLQAASIPSPQVGGKGKGLPAILDPDKAFLDKYYLGMTYCGPSPTQEAIDTLARITLATKPIAQGHIITLMVQGNDFPEVTSVHRLTLLATTTDYNTYQRKAAGRKYCDFRLVHQSKTNRGALELKDQHGTLRIPVGIFAKPKVSPRGKITVNRRDRQSVARVMDEYRNRRQRRSSPVPQITITQTMHDWSRPILPEAERCMTYQEWSVQFSTIRNLMRERYTKAIQRFAQDDSTALATIRTHLHRRDSLQAAGWLTFDEGQIFGVPAGGNFKPFTFRMGTNGPQTPIYDLGFGIHNCDQIQIMPAPVVLKPTFRHGDKQVQPRFTFCLYKQLNGMMLGDPPHNSNTQIYMDRQWTCSAVLVEGFDGHFYALPPKDIADLQLSLDNKHPILQLIDITQTAKTPETLRKYLAGENS